MKPRKSRGAVLIRRWRLEEELTHVQAAKRLRLSQATYTRIERGAQLPSLQAAIRIEDRLGIPVRQWVRKAPRR